MEINKEAIDNLWILVAATNRQVLVIDFLGNTSAYLIDSFSPKSRDSFFNEVFGAQDITDMSVNLPLNVAQLNSVTLEDKTQGRPKKDFKFGHDNYIWMISNRKNVY